MVVRGFVLLLGELTVNEKIHVFLGDYGFFDIVRITDIRLEVDLEEILWQAAPCFVDGVSLERKTWSSADIADFRKVILDEKFEVHSKSSNTNPTFVSLMRDGQNIKSLLPSQGSGKVK